MYCYKCGSELTGMKKYCVVCGTAQDKAQKDKIATAAEESTKSKEEAESGKCVRCGDETEKKCFFCRDFICRDHYTKMQANVNSYVTMQEYIAAEETKRINEGWRGFIVFSCPKCLRLKVSKQLTDDETVQISTVDECSWYKIESQTL